MDRETRVFLDFDNTITSFDVLDDLIQRFSQDKEWEILEADWAKGRITSKQCLEGQLRSIRVDKPRLLSYLSQIKVDPYFIPILDLLKGRGIAPVIVSDSFSFLIETILKNNGINGQYGLKIFSNRLWFRADRLIPEFPHHSAACGKCANCKRGHVVDKTGRGKHCVYIGDGRSDICAAQFADVVFAKDTLLKYFQAKKIKCAAFKDLKDVYLYLEGELNDSAQTKKTRR
ncbi:MAG: MtnX-like HAD-IB family phosphatase [Candidatus Omnitrophica bacterium]|nr:MtnX-like HAD-IB family phosphatase [Candidatus Omnitrophota bacterium]